MLTATLLLWLAATTVHVLLSAWEFAWLDPDPVPSVDGRVFGAMLGGVGTLSIVLHVLTMTGGMTLGRGLIALAVWHTAVTVAMRRWPAPERPVPRLDGIEWLAAIVAGAILLSWVDASSRSSAVVGTDAAHYHVPVAVNFAMGASLFAPPATPHLYPVAGSLFGAWFILPLGSPLLVDLSMCLPFLLLAASINMIFRQAVGISGLAWSSWLVLVLFATPLFRSSSLVSADLWFAAALASLVAVIVTAWQRTTSSISDLILGSLAAGLLVGSKTTGMPAALLVLGIGGSALLMRRIRMAPRPAMGRALLWLTVASTLVFGAGGAWLARNWLLFGSPLSPTGLTLFGHTIFRGDPVAPTEYLSILGDMRRTPDYDVLGRTAYFARLWLGRSWFVAMVPVALLAVDLAAGWRHGANRRDGTRAMLMTLTIVSAGVMTVTLAGAPWTSLEWTRGLALRYVLPFVALLLLVAFVGLFPQRWPWYRQTIAARAAALPLVAISSMLFVHSLAPNLRRGAPVPPLALTWLIAGVLLALALRTMRRVPDRWRASVGVAAMVLAAAAWTPVIRAREVRQQEAAARAETEEIAAWTRNHETASAARGVYLAAIDRERTGGLACASRRFYSLTRFDEPLTLQSSVYRNRVYYVRDTASIAHIPKIGACDYVITTAAMAGTDRGRESADVIASHRPLIEAGRSAEFVLLALGDHRAPATP